MKKQTTVVSIRIDSCKIEFLKAAGKHDLFKKQSKELLNKLIKKILMEIE